MKKSLLFFFLVFFIHFSDPAISKEKDPGAGEQDSTDLLTAFSARIKDKEVHLNWKITGLKAISHFEVLRQEPKIREYELINRKNRIKKDDYLEKSKDENGNEVLIFNYVDEPGYDGVYYYKIKAVNSKNEMLFESDEIKIGISGLKDFKLEQNHPNPFNPATAISYEIFEGTHVKLRVFDLIGREIAVLVDEFQNEGEYTVEFNASDYPNLTSGIYFYKLETEKYSDVKKMILTK
jgi:hypothetical protein